MIGVDDQQFGQRLAALVVLEHGASVTPEQLKQHVRDNLANYKVPREIIFIDELPRSSTGKIVRRELGHWSAPRRAIGLRRAAVAALPGFMLGRSQGSGEWSAIR